MNSKFSIVEQEELSLLVYTSWWEEGILHGMTLRPFSFEADDAQTRAAAFCNALGVSQLANPKQTHGDRFFDARDRGALEARRASDGSFVRFGEYDAILIPVSQNIPMERVAYAIATADCVPVVMRGDRGWGLVHAGWRGLANGIIGKVAKALGALEEVAIFGCAGGIAYEVGREVVDSIGDTAVYKVIDGDTVALDTAQTARQQLLPHVTRERIESAAICTIENLKFHSYRRDGNQAGRSLTFVSPSSIRLQNGALKGRF